MGRQDLLDLITRDRRRLIGLRAGMGAVGDPFPDPAALWRKPLLTMLNGPHKGQKLSLEDIIDRHRRLVMVDAGDGPAAAESVFASLLMVTPEPLADPANLDRFLSERIRQSFGPLIDPLDPIGVAVVTSLTTRRALTVHCGFGVHAPPLQAPPRGAVLFRPEGESVATPVTWPGGRTAGLYPGQRWLAFSREEADAPAHHPDLPADAAFLLTAPGEIAGQSADASGRPRLYALPASPSAATMTITVSDAPATRGVDEAFLVSATSAERGEQPLGHIEVVHDARPSRWRAAAAPGLGLRIMGIAMPQRLAGLRVERFWLELTEAGDLRASALRASAHSAVVKGARVRLYDRRGLFYRPGDSPFAVQSVKAGGESRTLILSEERALGYVALPAAPHRLSPERDRGDAGDWPLDWLDSSVIVDLAGRGPTALPDAWLGRQGPVLWQDRERVLIDSDADLFLLADGAARPPDTRWLTPGRRLILGPLVVDLIASAGGGEG